MKVPIFLVCSSILYNFANILMPKRVRLDSCHPQRPKRIKRYAGKKDKRNHVVINLINKYFNINMFFSFI